MKQALLALAFVGFVDLEAEAQVLQQGDAGTTMQQGNERTSGGTRTETRSRTRTRRSTFSAQPGQRGANNSAMQGTNRSPVIDNGLNPDGAPRNGTAAGNAVNQKSATVTNQGTTTISNGTYVNPTGSGQNSNTGDGTNRSTTPNSSSTGTNSTVTPATNVPR